MRLFHPAKTSFADALSHAAAPRQPIDLPGFPPAVGALPHGKLGEK
ncbi:MAG TPA: hypothetical protein VHZ09_19760 [Acidobacteriaceae bacterium]|nr:hypothetical protein [Acidobacteriaceae bacterium]